MDDARTLSETVVYLNRVVQHVTQQLYALEREGWQLQAPVEAGELVLVRPT
jgi:hypothetical protein